MSIAICLHTGLLVVPDEIVLLDPSEVQSPCTVDPILLVPRNRLIRLDPSIASHILENFRQHPVRVVLIDPVVEDEWIT